MVCWCCLHCDLHWPSRASSPHRIHQVFRGDLFNPRVRVIMAEERVCKSGKSSVIEIDSEDDAWDGTIDPLAFQQVREERQRLATIARLEAQNRAPESRTPCPGNTSAPADPSTG
eukprot:TRINITY_DN12401_c0_g1_i2.p1 TRINITY_DN12401_c0_g1~~TRINITY_DN12401_c0_g1_i2.p1  ORF type:complete len:115 (-),score=11.74 TRINITY_DN12401_c0_g1_i2:357-701(-)